MNQASRTVRRLVVTALLLSGVAMAQARANNTDNAKSTEHHSKLSKVAFWRHHNAANKNAKQNEAKPATPATSKQAQPKAAQVKPAAAKQSQPSKTQVRPVSAKEPARETEQKQATNKTVSPSAKKTTAKAPSGQPKESPQKSTTQDMQGSQKGSSKQ